MVFKGTTRRTAEDIAREVDSVGGMLDAFTSKEMVCFNTRVLDEHLPKAFDVLADMVLDPRFAEDEIDREKSVILEEIRMTQDNPEDLVHELFTQNFWSPHALGKPILGTPETVSSFTRDTLRDWFTNKYAPNNMVITAAGHLTHAQLVDLVAERFSKLPSAQLEVAECKPEAAQHVTLRTKHELEQVHLCLGVPALPMTDKRRFAVAVLNNVLGGGMSSRLFQNIRERQGLAYAIFSELNSYRDAGALSVYAGTSLAMVRSFAEHRAESIVERRTAIVEKSWILGPLFLFNNLHVAHHMRHTMPWYALPAWYNANRAALIERNGGLVYDSYRDVIRRYLLRPHDQALHPHRKATAAQTP